MGVNQNFDIVNSFNKSEAVEFDSAELTNLFIEDDPMGKNRKAAFQTPGLNLSTGIDFGTNAVGRRLYPFQDVLYGVVGEKVFATNSSLNYTNIGAITTSTGPVGIADNGRQIVFVDGSSGWVYDVNSGAFSSITAAGFPASPTDVSVLGSRFVVNSAGTNQVFFSAQNDGTSWDPLDFFSITSQPDQVVGLRRLNDRLFVMGERITEVWYDAGVPIEPFRRSDVLPYGCAAVGSIFSAFGALVWLSKDDNGVGSVVLTGGTEPKNISTKKVETEIERYDDVGDAAGFIYRNEMGHVFYQLNFTLANKSWAFDLTENRCLRLEHNSQDRHLAQDHAYFNGKHYVIDYSSSKMYELSRVYKTDNGVSIRRQVISPVLFDPSYYRLTLNSILFDLKQGVGSHVDNNVDYFPVLNLQVSRDGGISYGNELSQPIGEVGQRLYRTQFFRLGQSRSFVLKITYDYDTDFVLLGCSINVDGQTGGF